MSRFDERDAVLSRANLVPGTPEYEDYYQRHPELKETDDRLRSLPPLFRPGGEYYDPLSARLGESTFNFLADLNRLCEGPVREERLEVDPAAITSRLKSLARYYGAVKVGVAELTPECYYSHRGRRSENYGEPVEDLNPYALVFLVEMARENINRAPAMPEAIEATKGYARAGFIGMIISYYIRELGYRARNHMDGNYLLIGPLTAMKAGLGELGRNGLLVTKEYGPRVRIGMVSTDLDLVPDGMKEFGLKGLCEKCSRCADACHGEAVPAGPRQGERWRIRPEKCYEIWRRFGTDCGLCLSQCPLAQPVEPELLDGLPHSAEEILRRHSERYGPRVRTEGDHPWL